MYTYIQYIYTYSFDTTHFLVFQSNMLHSGVIWCESDKNGHLLSVPELWVHYQFPLKSVYIKKKTECLSPTLFIMFYYCQKN